MPVPSTVPFPLYFVEAEVEKHKEQEMWEVVNLLDAGSVQPQVITNGFALCLPWLPIIGGLSFRAA